MRRQMSILLCLVEAGAAEIWRRSQDWCRLNHVDANSDSSYWDGGAPPTIRHGCGESAQHHPSKRLEFSHHKPLMMRSPNGTLRCRSSDPGNSCIISGLRYD